MNPEFVTVTRREYIHVGSTAASMLQTVTATNTEFIPPDLPGRKVQLLEDR